MFSDFMMKLVNAEAQHYKDHKQDSTHISDAADGDSGGSVAAGGNQDSREWDTYHWGTYLLDTTAGVLDRARG